MDATLGQLAVSGAQALVNLMITDAWGGAKKVVARIFSSRPDSVQQEIMRGLEAARLQLTAGDTPSFEIQQREQDRWEALLRLRLLEEPDVASLISDIVELARLTNSDNSVAYSKINLKATAKDNARVYQQGQGTQHNG